jgi:hypothetical protein
MRDKHQIIEEPCEGKLSRTVLKTSGVGDSLAEFNSIGWSYVDTEGNLKAHGQIPLEMGLPSGKQQAQIVDACLYAANLAICFACPVVCEELDFADKKERLGEQGKKYARMLSSWAYSEFFRQLNSVLSNRGIERLHGQSCLQFNDWAGEVHENVRTSQ